MFSKAFGLDRDMERIKYAYNDMKHVLELLFAALFTFNTVVIFLLCAAVGTLPPLWKPSIFLTLKKSSFHISPHSAAINCVMEIGNLHCFLSSTTFLYLALRH